MSADTDMAEAMATAQSRWPGVVVSAETFAAYVVERAPAASPGADRLLDLYLACACAEGVEGAAAALQSEHAGTVRAALARYRVTDDLRREAEQLTWHRLLVAEPGAAPRIAQYSGRAALGGFLRIVASRVALNLIDRIKYNDGDDEIAAFADAAPDPELQYLKTLYRSEFRQAFETALHQLDRRDRLLLRYRILDGLTIEQVAAIDGKPRSTIGRQMVDARARLVDGTRKVLRGQLKVSRSELDSVLRLVESSADVSVRRLLAEGA